MTNEVKTRKLCDSAQSDINQPACEIVVPANRWNHDMLFDAAALRGVNCICKRQCQGQHFPFVLNPVERKAMFFSVNRYNTRHVT